MEDGYSKAYGKCPKCGCYKIEQKRYFVRGVPAENLGIGSQVFLSVVFGILGFIITVVVTIVCTVLAALGVITLNSNLVYFTGITLTVGCMLWALFTPIKGGGYAGGSGTESRCCICGYEGIGTWEPDSYD